MTQQQPKPQGPSFGPSHLADQKGRREVLRNDVLVSRENDRKLRMIFDTPSQAGPEVGTFYSHTHNETGGRFAAAQVDKSNVSGSQPTTNYPMQPGNSFSNQQTAVGVEPFIDGRDSGNEYGIALGEPHEQPELAGERAASGSSSPDRCSNQTRS